ncbi:MAG: ABC transporter ATP-binding protein/permease [Acidobacteria bacterium]|nr:ABC transporter ATP-binding protein/permease [Acidobacteriota bacterium]
MRNLKRLLAYVRPHSGWLVVGALMMVAVGLLEGAAVLLLRPVVHLILQPNAAASDIVLAELPDLGRTLYLQDFVPVGLASAGALVVAAILAIYFIKAAGEYFGEYCVNRLGHAVVMDLRNRLYAHTLRQSLSFFHRQRTGQLMSTAINDIDRVQVAVSVVLADFFRQAFALPVLLLLVFLVDWRLALVSFLAVPLIVFPVAEIGRRIRRISRRQQEELGALNDVLQETYTGIRIVQAFGGEDWEAGRFGDRARRLFHTSLRWLRYHALISPLMEVMGAATIALLLLYARQRISSGGLAPEMMFVFVAALVRTYQPVRRLAGIYGQFQQALGASEKVFELLDQREVVAERPGASALPPLRQRVEFDEVSFGYDDGPPLLRGISLRAEVGEVVALAGSSGAGKTTLVNLLPRFYDPTAGAVRIDGRDIREVSVASLRAQIGIVTQETVLFNDTVAANIRYGRRNATQAEIEAAAQAAYADEFIRQLPHGYETIIGERGVRLSGGQRQRLAIARALLKNAPILILDEATSELDAESELLVQQALANLMQGRTVFVVAHRLSTIRRSDQILVLEDGQIRERGRHEELLARGGLYQRLYELQFVDQDAPRVETGEPI